MELSSASRRKAPKRGAESKTNSGTGKKTVSGGGNYGAFGAENTAAFGAENTAASGNDIAAFGDSEDEPDGPDLFSDLRPQPVTPPADEETSGDGEGATGGAATSGAVTGGAVSGGAPPHPALGQDEADRSGETAAGRTADSAPPSASDGEGENGERAAGAKPDASTDVTSDVTTDRPGTDGGADGRTGSPGAQRPPGEAPQPPPDEAAGEVTDEVTDALAARPGDSPEKGKAELAEEAAALLNLAEEAGRRGVWERLRATLENYLAHLAEAPELVDWRARRLQVRLAVNDRATGPALQAFEDMLAAGYQPDVDGTPGLLEELLDGGERKLADTLRVSMLVRILAVFRQNRDQAAMDRAYGWIEAAQERAGDEKRLLQYLKNHLEIRKALGNVPGQLELIVQIGNRCFKLGLTGEAKTYYEMGLKLRGESEDDQAPAGDDDSAVG